MERLRCSSPVAAMLMDMPDDSQDCIEIIRLLKLASAAEINISTAPLNNLDGFQSISVCNDKYKGNINMGSYFDSRPNKHTKDFDCLIQLPVPRYKRTCYDEHIDCDTESDSISKYCGWFSLEDETQHQNNAQWYNNNVKFCPKSDLLYVHNTNPEYRLAPISKIWKKLSNGSI